MSLPSVAAVTSDSRLKFAEPVDIVLVGAGFKPALTLFLRPSINFFRRLNADLGIDFPGMAEFRKGRPLFLFPRHSIA